ncbi:MAG: hypothetical protein HQ592_06475 [Planctomycetes bacterium]|nr:hypothetical protein [Planctomycetota bacterium]
MSAPYPKRKYFTLWLCLPVAFLLALWPMGCRTDYDEVPVVKASHSPEPVYKYVNVATIQAEKRYGGAAITASAMPHGEHRAYLWAKNMGTLVSYETFLRRHPEGELAGYFRDQIRSRFVPDEGRWKEAWTLYSQMEVIAGAMVDPDIGVVLFGHKDTGRLSPFMFEDLVTALRCSLAGDDVGVTMSRVFDARFAHDDTPREYPYVAFETSVEFYSDHLWNSHLAYTLFEGDRMLKSLSHGYDIFLREPIRSKIPGFKTIIEMAAAEPVEHLRASGRSDYSSVWIELTRVTVHTTEKRNVAVFRDFEVEVRAKSKHSGPMKFAEHLKEHYAEYAAEFPIFAEVERAARVVAISRWMIKEHPEVAKRLVDNSYSAVKILTPQVVPARYDTTHSTRLRKQGLIGGVTFPNVNKYKDADTPVLGDTLLSELPESTLRQRPDDETEAWYVQAGHEPEEEKGIKWIAWNVRPNHRSNHQGSDEPDSDADRLILTD